MVRRRGPHVHDQYRAGEDIVSHLKMSGLAGTDQGGAGFGDDPHRRIARLLEDLAIALPLSPIPACGTAYIKTAVLPFNQASGHIEFSQDASREALNIADTGRIREKAALKTKASLHCIRCVAGLFSDQKFSCAQAGISRDEASHLPDGYHLRLGLLAFSQICDGTLGVAQVKSKIPIHLFLPACAFRTEDTAAFYRTAVPFFKSLPSCASAGRMVTTLSSSVPELFFPEEAVPGRDGSISNHAAYCALQGSTSTSFLCR